MMNTCSTVCRVAAVFALCTFGMGGITLTLADGATPDSEEARRQAFLALSVDQLIARLREDPSRRAFISRLAQLGDARAVPALREEFDKADTLPLDAQERKSLKQLTAAALLRLGARDDSFFDHLAGYARAAVDSDMPFPMAFDSTGHMVPNTYSEDFLAWCRAHGVQADAVAGQIYLQELDLTFLAWGVDERSLPIFVHGLRSKNYQVVVAAIKGLVILQQRGRVGELIAAIERMPAEFRSGAAKPLVFMNDPAAQAAAERWITNKALLADLRKKAQEKGPKALLP